jgi:lysophospholipid acyltransferase
MITAIDTAFAYLAPYSGLPKDQLKLVTILYAVVPLCSILKRLPDEKPHLKNLYNIAYVPSILDVVPNGRISLFILVGVYDLWTGLWIILSSAIGTYVLTFRLQGPMMPWIVFIFVMGQMSISQLIRQIYKTPDDVIDYTGYDPLLFPFNRVV